MNKASFVESNTRLINRFSTTIKIKTKTGISHSSLSSGGFLTKKLTEEWKDIEATISNVELVHKETFSFDVSAYVQILKLKTLSSDVKIGDIFKINEREYETIQISEYSNCHGRGLKIHVGLKRGSF